MVNACNYSIDGWSGSVFFFTSGFVTSREEQQKADAKQRVRAVTHTACLERWMDGLSGRGLHVASRQLWTPGEPYLAPGGTASPHVGFGPCHPSWEGQDPSELRVLPRAFGLLRPPIAWEGQVLIS